MLTASSPKYKKDANFCPIKREGSSCSANSPRYLRMGKSMKGNKQAESLLVVEISRVPRQTHAVVQSQKEHENDGQMRLNLNSSSPHYFHLGLICDDRLGMFRGGNPEAWKRVPCSHAVATASIARRHARSLCGHG